MATVGITRKDINGNSITKSKKDRNYHISFKDIFAEIIDVQSFKAFNKIRDDDSDDGIDDEEPDIDPYSGYKPYTNQKMGKNTDPKAISKGGCLLM